VGTPQGIVAEATGRAQRLVQQATQSLPALPALSLGLGLGAALAALVAAGAWHQRRQVRHTAPSPKLPRPIYRTAEA
jgi:hypothetical protein